MKFLKLEVAAENCAAYQRAPRWTSVSHFLAEPLETDGASLIEYETANNVLATYILEDLAGDLESHE